MSFDVYVQSFRNGEFSGIPRERVRRAFGTYLTEVATEYWLLHFDGVASCEIDIMPHAADPDMMDGFTIHGPCADRRLWAALATILGVGNIVLYFPGGRAPLVAHSNVARHLPSSMVEALGPPLVVSSGEEIGHEIRTA